MMPIVEVAEIKFFFQRKGSGGKLVLFPDNLLSSDANQDDIDHFSKHFEVIAFDHPTLGKSTYKIYYPDEREVDYWGFWAELACHLLIELGIEQWYALGVGGGALTALHFAGKQAHQNQTFQGWTINSFRADWDSRTLHRWLDIRDHFYVRNEASLQDQHGDDWRQVLDQDTHFIRRLADRGGYSIPDRILNAINCPTLLRGHHQDPVLPNLVGEYARIRQIIPNCSIYLSAKITHPYLERPFMWSDRKTFRSAVNLFLNQNRIQK